MFHVKHSDKQNLWLTGIGICGFPLFAYPYFSHYVKIGSVGGMVLCLFLAVYGLFLSRIHPLLKKFVQKFKKLILLFCAFAVILVTIESVCIFRAASTPEPEPGRTILVLASGTNPDGTPPLLVVKRLEKAVEYYQKDTNTSFIVCGGIIANGVLEAQTMKDWLIQNGIEETKIYMEDQSTSTAENIKNALEIIKTNGLNDKIAVSTNSFHLYRVRYLAKSVNVDAGLLRAKTPWWLLPTYYPRELACILFYWIFGV